MFNMNKVQDFYLLDTAKYYYEADYGKEVGELELLKIFMDDNLPGDYAYINDIFLNHHGTYPYRYRFERYNPMNIIESFALDTPLYFDKETYSRKWSGEGTLNKSIPLILNGMPNNFDTVGEVSADKIETVYLAEAFTKVDVAPVPDKYEKIKSDFKFNLINGTAPLNAFATAAFEDTGIFLSDSFSENARIVKSDALGTVNVEKTNTLTLNGFLLFGEVKVKSTDSEKLGNALVDTESSKLSDVLLDTSSKNPSDYTAGTTNTSTLNNFTLLSVFDRMMADVDEGVETAGIHVSDTGGNISHSTLNNMLLSSKIQPDEVKAVEEHAYGISMKDDFEDEIIYLEN